MHFKRGNHCSHVVLNQVIVLEPNFLNEFTLRLLEGSLRTVKIKIRLHRTCSLILHLRCPIRRYLSRKYTLETTTFLCFCVLLKS